MSRLTAVVRFVLALVAFLWLSAPFAGLLTPPDPFTQLIGLGIGAIVAVPVAVAFVRQSYSLERLYGYLLAVNVLVMLVAIRWCWRALPPANSALRAEFVVRLRPNVRNDSLRSRRLLSCLPSRLSRWLQPSESPIRVGLPSFRTHIEASRVLFDPRV